MCATCSGLQAGVRGHPRPAWLGGGGLLGPAKCGRTPSRPPVLYTSRPQLDGKCTLIRKSQHSIPRYGARTGGAQRSSRAPYYGGATHITPRFRKKSPYYGVGANRWACSQRALRGALSACAPKIGAPLTTLLVESTLCPKQLTMPNADACHDVHKYLVAGLNLVPLTIAAVDLQ